MGRKQLVGFVVLPFMLFGGVACAMNTDLANEVRCSLLGAQLLPLDVGGAQGVCAEIQRAAAAAGAGPVKVVVTVHSSSELTAEITNKHGHVLPELRFAKSDRPLSRASVRRFARTIAELAGR